MNNNLNITQSYCLALEDFEYVIVTVSFCYMGKSSLSILENFSFSVPCKKMLIFEETDYVAFHDWSVETHLKLRDAESNIVYCMTDGLVTVFAMDSGMRLFLVRMISMHNIHSRGDSQKASIQLCNSTN